MGLLQPMLKVAE